jgi:GntR family transcriptional regulator
MANSMVYQKIYSQLRDRILQGFYAVGQKIPTERQFCSEFGVSRITTRHAIKLLQDQGLLESRQGTGTFVRGFRPPKFPILNTDYSRSVTAAVPNLNRRLHRSGQIVPPCQIADLLGNLRAQKCFFALRVDDTPEGPIAFDRVYIALPYSENLDENTLTRVDFLEAWADKERFEFSHFVETIEAVPADADAAELLHLDFGRPVLMTTDVVYSKASAVLGIFESFYHGNKVKLISTIRKALADVQHVY